MKGKSPTFANAVKRKALSPIFSAKNMKKAMSLLSSLAIDISNDLCLCVFFNSKYDLQLQEEELGVYSKSCLFSIKVNRGLLFSHLCYPRYHFVCI